MARHYSVKEFFRQAPNKLLERFFHAHNLFTGLDFKNMKEAKPDKLFDAWISLPEAQRNPIDSILQEIFELSCEKGSLAIMDEARWQMKEDAEKLSLFTEMLSQLPNHYHRAMTTYLDYSECWKGATHFYYADTLNYWRKRKYMGHNSAAVNATSVNQLANLIRNYFHYTEGRGKNCIVEVFRRGDLDYFFAYPEDFSQQSIEWVNNEFDKRPHNPAFQIIFIYSQKNGSLDIYFDGSYKAIEPLQSMFATAILKLDEILPNPKDNRIYDFDCLRNRYFNFTYKINSGISDVTVRKIRFSSRIKPGNRIIVEASENKNDLYDQIEDMCKSIPLNLHNITQVELVATMMIDMNKPPKKITFRLTHPNSCSLKYDEIGLKLREMLEASGIELKEPTVETVTPELVDA